MLLIGFLVIKLSGDAFAFIFLSDAGVSDNPPVA